MLAKWRSNTTSMEIRARPPGSEREIASASVSLISRFVAGTAAALRRPGRDA
jgi:hypothetical protein